MHGYDLALWESFFLAEVGAAAALTGLLFVAVSINLDRILSFPRLPSRALETLALLLLVLVISSLGLLPQSAHSLAVQIVVLAGLTAVVSFVAQVRGGRDSPTDPVYWLAARISVTVVPALVYVGGAASLLSGGGGGLFWVAAATLLAFVGAVYTAWVLLVQVVRHRP